MIKLTTTKKTNTHVKALVYASSGMGKTVLCSTAPSPIIISAEAGLLSIADHDIPVIEVNTVDDVKEAYKWITESKEANDFETVCLDSITEIAEVLLAQYKLEEKDPRKAYGRLNDNMSTLIRSFRDLKRKHVYFSCKMIAKTDESSDLTTYRPSMPGNTLTNNLPYWFDEVLAMRIGKLSSGEEYRYLQTQPELQWPSKDRSGCLSKIEKPDLTYVFNKILSGKKKIKEEIKDNEEVLKDEKKEEEAQHKDKDKTTDVEFKEKDQKQDPTPKEPVKKAAIKKAVN